MSLVNNCENIVQAALRVVESDENSVIRLNANGGNSILVVCDPLQESDYIKMIRKLMTNDKYDVIDLNDILCKFVLQNKLDIDDSFEFLKGSIQQIFKLPEGEEGTD